MTSSTPCGKSSRTVGLWSAALLGCLALSVGSGQENQDVPPTGDDSIKRQQKKAQLERVLADTARWRVFEQGDPVPKTRAEIPEPEIAEAIAEPQAILSAEEMQALADQAQRYLSKPWVTDVLVATVVEEGFTEIEIVRGARRLKALVNADLSHLQLPSIIEAEHAIYQPLVLVTKGESLADLRARNPALLENLAPAPLGGAIEYIVGYDPAFQSGQPADYESLDALLDYWERTSQRQAR